MNDTANPYLTPLTDPVVAAARNDFHEIATPVLKKLRNDSSSIRTFAVLLLLGVVLMLAALLVPVFSDNAGGSVGMAELAIIGGFSAFNLATAIGLLKRSTWGRVLGFVSAAFALVGFPIGTLIGILVLVALGRGGRLFGPARLDHKALQREWKYRKANKIP